MKPEHRSTLEQRLGRVIEINGPIVTIAQQSIENGEQVALGRQRLTGSVIALKGEHAIVQAYESTAGLRPGEPVEGLGRPLSVELGPGLLSGIFDGVQRPLLALKESAGDLIPQGAQAQALNPERKWDFSPNPELQPGQRIGGGTILGEVPETQLITHRVLLPPMLEGTLQQLAPAGSYTVEDEIGQLQDDQGRVHSLRMAHHWPVHRPRPFRRRDEAVAPLLTGQRVIDTFFPVLKGGRAAIPGPFGAGKTMVQHQVARWSNADIVIYVGCGERGNELVDVLDSFPKLEDPASGKPLMERTLLIANTSNMPVVAREASIYVGVTIAEYFRDQGYDVVMVADSTSRWAEALREVAGRLNQMPVEEGYPAYLASRLAAFYERAGRVETSNGKLGSVTLIGAVSPPGGDFSEPVTSHTKELAQVFWALSKPLADARHYPSIDWNDSFSSHVALAAEWWNKQIDPGWLELRNQALGLLARAEELMRIVNLVGPESLSPEQRWELEGAAMIREGVLQQSALDDKDSYCSPEKQYLLLEMTMKVFKHGIGTLKQGVPVNRLLELPVLAQIRRLKSRFSSQQIEEIRKFADDIRAAFDALRVEYGVKTGAE